MDDLPNHLQYCIFDISKLPDHVKNYLNFTKNNSSENINEDEDDPSSNYLGFNKNSCLKARLFNKNQDMILNALNGNNSINKNSIFNMSGTDDDFINNLMNNKNNNNSSNNSKKNLENNTMNNEINNNFNLNNNPIQGNLTKNNMNLIKNKFPFDSPYTILSMKNKNNKINNDNYIQNIENGYISSSNQSVSNYSESSYSEVNKEILQNLNNNNVLNGKKFI